MNAPWCSSDINCAPLSSLTDGQNDLLIKTEEGGAGSISLTRILLDQDAGEYFTPEGALRPELHLQYSKAREWTLDPQVKGPRENVPVPEGYQYRDDAIFSIDGEKYPA